MVRALRGLPELLRKCAEPDEAVCEGTPLRLGGWRALVQPARLEVALLDPGQDWWLCPSSRLGTGLASDRGARPRGGRAELRARQPPRRSGVPSHTASSGRAQLRTAQETLEARAARATEACIWTTRPFRACRHLRAVRARPSVLRERCRCGLTRPEASQPKSARFVAVSRIVSVPSLSGECRHTAVVDRRLLSVAHHIACGDAQPVVADRARVRSWGPACSGVSTNVFCG